MSRSPYVLVPAPMAEVEIKVYDDASHLVAYSKRPRSVTIKSPLHDLTAKAWVELHYEDVQLPLDFGYQTDILIDGIQVFRGRIAHIRYDSIEAPLTFLAKREPRVLFPHHVRRIYTNVSPTEILVDILESTPEPRLSYSISEPSARKVERLEFLGQHLFDAIGLLSVLDGNALWGISWDSVLHYRSRDVGPHHRIRFDPDRMTIRLWRTDDDIHNAFVFHGGVKPPGGAEFQRAFSDQESVGRFGRRSGHLYARPITTQADYQLLRDAVLSLIPQPETERFLEATGFLPVAAGDVILLDSLPFPLAQEIRRRPIEMVEFDYRHGQVTTRLHFNAGPRVRQIRGDRVLTAMADAVTRRLGPFQLDLSALDSPAHLDSIPS